MSNFNGYSRRLKCNFTTLSFIAAVRTERKVPFTDKNLYFFIFFGNRTQHHCWQSFASARYLAGSNLPDICRYTFSYSKEDNSVYAVISVTSID